MNKYICKDDVIVGLILVLVGILVNAGIEMKGLYMDDLYLWSCYGEQSFTEYVFPIGSTRFRFIYYFIAWLQMAVIGTHVTWFVPMNIFLNVILAFMLYRMAKNLSSSAYVGAICSVLFLFSRMAYYQISQVYGLMETVAMFMALGILYCLYQYLTEKEYHNYRVFYQAVGLYFAICFVHERYMVLLPLFFLVLAFKRERNFTTWVSTIGTFLFINLIRFFTIGGLAPAGTGGTDVVDTFSIGATIQYAVSQVAYLFGINAGPEYLNGQNFRESSVMILVLIGVANLFLLGICIAFFMTLIRNKKDRIQNLMVSTLFLGFIGGCIACSSVTIRVELRWIYVSFAAALLFLSWMYGRLIEEQPAASYLFMISVYVILMLPVELYYRGMIPNIYLWPNQTRYNSLAEETYGRYGDDIFGKEIYIIGNTYEMSDFTARTFFKVFDSERIAEGTSVTFIEDIRSIGLITEDMVVLQEDPEINGFQDVTKTIKELKLHGISGYYEDGWLDERAELQVMAGSSGVIELSFYYPGELIENQGLVIYVNEEAVSYLEFTDNLMTETILVDPYSVIKLRTEANFWVADAQEQRSEWRLATVLSIIAD